MIITDPTTVHSSTRSIVSKATQWTIDALTPLREHLSPWPVVLPSEVGDPIRPLKIGVHTDLAAMLPDGEAHEVLGRVLRRYTRSTQYLGDGNDSFHQFTHRLGVAEQPLSTGLDRL